MEGPHLDVSEVRTKILEHFQGVFADWCSSKTYRKPPVDETDKCNIFTHKDMFQIFSYLMSICVSSVYVCHVNKLYTQLQKQQCTCFSTFELKNIIWLVYRQTVMIYSNVENFCFGWYIICYCFTDMWLFFTALLTLILFSCLTPRGQNNSC